MKPYAVEVYDRSLWIKEDNPGPTYIKRDNSGEICAGRGYPLWFDSQF